jgi:hypothetical protein
VRNKQIDLLRFIGLSFLILGHVEPSGWLFQLRNFNVPLVIMASAMALTQVSLKENYWHYVWKRINRLVFPVWIFLTFYFLFLWITGLDPKKLTAQNIWDNYTLSNAGGFMWIIRIFLLVALSAPFTYQLSQKIQSNKTYLGILLLAYILYEGLLYLLNLCPDDLWKDYIVSFVGYALGYGLVFALGLRLSKLTTKELWLVGEILLFVFAALCAILYVHEGHLVSTQAYKYPPSAYYLSYAIVASLVTWWCSKCLCEYLSKFPRAEGVVMFSAQNSLWIYLWHTIFLLITYRMHHQIFLAKYFVVYSLAILTVFVQVTIIHKWILPSMNDEKARKEIRTLLTG